MPKKNIEPSETVTIIILDSAAINRDPLREGDMALVATYRRVTKFEGSMSEALKLVTGF
jgi:hypothetical protein